MESPVPRPVMLATLGGCLALLLGIAVLLLPLLTPELSRPRDTFWGAVVLLLGLVLVTSAERLTGAPMLAVLCGGLLIGRLGGEVGRGRWNQLSPEERSALATTERWASGFNQLAAALTRLLGMVQAWAGVLAGWLAARRQPKSTGKLWVRPEGGVGATPPEAGADATPPALAAAEPSSSGAGSDQPTSPLAAQPAPSDTTSLKRSSGPKSSPADAGGIDPGAAAAPANVAAPVADRKSTRLNSSHSSVSRMPSSA